MAKSRSTLRSNLDTYTGDSANTLWTEAQKNLAINLAIGAAWPEIKAVAKVAFALAAPSHTYRLADFSGASMTTSFTLAPWGPQQVWISTSACALAPLREVRGSVHKYHAGVDWWIGFEKDYLDDHDGYQVVVRFNQKYAELGSDSATTEAPESYILPRALFHLCTMQALHGHHTDVETFRQQKPDFYQEALDAKALHRTEALADSIRLEWA